MFEHGVEDNQQLAHAGCEGQFLRFASGNKPLVEVPDGGVVATAKELIRIRSMDCKRLSAALAMLGVSGLLLGSSICGPADLSDFYAARWYNSEAQLTAHWTPDGSHIVFGHAGRIYVVDVNGSKLRTLSGSFEPANLFSETTELDFSPSVSPDGSTVVYTTLRYARGDITDHTYEIASQAIHDTDRRRLTKNDWHDVSPAWSPDGSRIAFVSFRGNGPRIYTIAPDGSDERSVALSVRAARADPPSWSPDGSRLAFVGAEGEDVSLDWVDTYYSDESKRVTATVKRTIYREAVYTVRPDGSDLRKLAWSKGPEAFPRTRMGVSDISSPEEAVRSFRWSPDGKRIAFVASYYGERDGIYVANLDGSDVRQIFDLTTITGTKQNTLGWIIDFAWSRDGSLISFEAGGRTTYVYRGLRRPVASVYTIASDGSDLRLLISRADLRTYLKWPDRLEGTGPERIVRYTDSTGPNAEPEIRGWILSTVPWGEKDEQVLTKISGGRLVAANPPQLAAADFPRSGTPEDKTPCSDDDIVFDADKRPGLVDDCNTLLDIKDKLSGDAVLNWSMEFPIYEWQGIEVSNRSSRVTSIYMGPNVLVGPKVQLTGTIPPEIGELTNLIQLLLGGNALGGSITRELGSLTDLHSLNLSGNSLDDAIPPELGNLSRLRTLDLSGNSLDGAIPPELGNLSNLEALDLSGNNLDGAIPPELGNLSNLVVLDLSGNNLDGAIPPELGNLSNLEVLDLSGNDLDGAIPLELSRLDELRQLNLGDNPLQGQIPPELGDLKKLRRLTIDLTRVTGRIPPELGKLYELRELHLQGSSDSKGSLSGPIPSELSELSKLRKLSLEHNRLEGTIPPETGDLVGAVEDGYSKGLFYVNLSGNLLTGCVPTELQSVRNIHVDLPFCE